MKYKKNYFYLFLVSTLIFFIFTGSHVFASLPSTHEDQIIYIDENNSVNNLIVQNENERISPLEYAQLFTAYISLETLNNKLSSTISFENGVGFVSIPEEETNEDSDESNDSEIKLTYQDLINVTLLTNNEEASELLGINIGKKILNDKEATDDEALEAFINKMNSVVKDLGLQETQFSNVTGEYSEDQYTTALELNSLLNKIYSNNTLVRILKSDKYSYSFSTKKNNLEIENLHSLFNNSSTFIENEKINEENIEESESTKLKTVNNDSLVSYGYTNSNNLISFVSQFDNVSINGLVMDDTIIDGLDYINSVLNEFKLNYVLTNLFNENNIYDSVTILNTHFSKNKELELAGKENVTLYIPNSISNNLNSAINWDPQYISQEENELYLNQTIDPYTQIGTLSINDVDLEIPLYNTTKLEVRNWTDSIFGNIIWIVLVIILLLIIWRLIYVHNRRKMIRRKKIARMRARKRAMQRRNIAYQNSSKH